MTKEELLQSVSDENYKNIQIRIREAMASGEKETTLVTSSQVPGCLILPSSVERLKKDGFTITTIENKFGTSIIGVKVSW